jgi:hypothetical protein
MNDDEIDDLILGRLQQRTLSATDLADFFNERIMHSRPTSSLADQGRIKESNTAHDRWVISLLSDDAA